MALCVLHWLLYMYFLFLSTCKSSAVEATPRVYKMFPDNDRATCVWVFAMATVSMCELLTVSSWLFLSTGSIVYLSVLSVCVSCCVVLRVHVWLGRRDGPPATALLCTAAFQRSRGKQSIYKYKMGQVVDTCTAVSKNTTCFTV